MIEAVRIPRLPRSARWGYYKISRKTGEMAQAIGAVLHDPERGSRRAVMGATETVPLVFDDTADLFRNGDRAGFANDLDPGVAEERLRTAGMTDAIDRRLHVTALKRALERAVQS
jgi:aerobic carbon-monoxide dehydrogenase medium subunit